MELSEYVMPGLGGRALWREHAVETARVLSAVDPHFIRLRTLAVAPGTPLEELAASGRFDPMTDEEVVAEIRLLIETLEVTSTLRSAHVLNLLPELEGRLPADRPRLLEVIDRFLSLEERMRRAFVLGRRAGLVSCLGDLEEPVIRDRALALLARVEAEHGGDIHAAVRDLMQRFV
jgi:hypothetical protein